MMFSGDTALISVPILASIPEEIGEVDFAGLGLRVWNYDPDYLTFVKCESTIADAVFNTYSDRTPWNAEFVNFTLASEGNITLKDGDKVAVLTFQVSKEEIGAEWQLNLDTLYDDGFARNNGQWFYDENDWGIEAHTWGNSVRILRYRPGDLDGDGQIAVKDVQALLKYILGYPLEKTGITSDVLDNTHWMDVSGDGRVDLYDATRLLQFIANWRVDLHYNG